ncbi:YdcF family protein [Bacillus mangrovi]|uniref:YdcF family protein n=2 Tax=Metabacillus mangrovi TaxID=1491830 RepID=A0A7X2V4E3_9BACI|nr:YdcF family protein [Metabacillus mangrovi]
MNKNRILIFAALILMAGGLIYLIYLHSKILSYAQAKPAAAADYLIVLGAKVNGDVPSLALQYRVDAAAEYLKRNKETIVIVSGGKGPGEAISEAEAMKRSLIVQGISSGRIIKEDQSASTYENIVFSKRLLPVKANSGIIVSSDFHLYRSIMMAESQNLSVTGLAAKTPEVILVKSYIREYLAVTKFYIER